MSDPPRRNDGSAGEERPHPPLGSAPLVEICIARQPIFDTSDRLVGYELLYRSAADAQHAAGVSTDQMSADVLIGAVLSFGLDRLTGGAPAFLNLTRDTLLGGYIEVLDPSRVVLEVLESVELDAPVRDTLARLHRRGYRIALDDFVFQSGWKAIAPVTSVIKVDVLPLSSAQIGETAARLRATGATLLAERVETLEVRDLCRDAGYTLFQGYYYHRPETITRRDMSVEQLHILELIQLLSSIDTPEEQIEEAFRADAALAMRLLRMANTASYTGYRVDSIRQALRLVGRATLQRWMAMLLLSSGTQSSGTSRELLLTAMQRGRLCEALAEAQGAARDRDALFLTGLFSLLDATLGMPMTEILERLPLSQEIQDALLNRRGPYSLTLRLAEAYEGGRWDDVSALAAAAGLSEARTAGLYLESLGWAQEQSGAARL